MKKLIIIATLLILGTVAVIKSDHTTEPTRINETKYKVSVNAEYQSTNRAKINKLLDNIDDSDTADMHISINPIPKAAPIRLSVTYGSDNWESNPSCDNINQNGNNIIVCVGDIWKIKDVSEIEPYVSKIEITDINNGYIYYRYFTDEWKNSTMDLKMSIGIFYLLTEKLN